MYRVRAAATFFVSLLFAAFTFLLLAPLAYAQLGTSGLSDAPTATSLPGSGTGDDAANKQCPKPDATHKYDSAKGKQWNETLNGAVITVTNLYGKACAEKQGSVNVRGFCTAEDKCKATHYIGEDGKERSVSDVEKQIDEQTKPAETTQKTGEEITGEMQEANRQDQIKCSFEGICTGASQPPENIADGSYSPTKNPSASQTNSGLEFNKYLGTLTGTDFSGFGGEFSNVFDGSVLSSWEQSTYMPPDVGGFNGASGFNGETGFSGAPESTGFRGDTSGFGAQSTGFEYTQPNFGDLSQYGVQSTPDGLGGYTYDTGSIGIQSDAFVNGAASVDFLDNPWTMPQAPAFTEIPQTPLPGLDDTSPLPNTFNDPVADPFGAQRGYTPPVETNWAGTNTPFNDYLNTGGKSVAEVGLGVSGALQEFAGAQGETPERIETPADLITARSPQAIEFGVGKTIEDTVPALALQGRWADTNSNFGRLSGDISWVNGNRSDIAAEYSYALEPGIVHGFWPTPAQLAGGEGGPLAGADEAFDVGANVESINPGTAPSDQVTGLTPDETLEFSGKPGIPTEQTFDITAYYPCQSAGACPVQGGPASSQPGLDGESKVRTLDDYRLGKSEYVTGASDKSRYGETYEIPKITYKSDLDGKTYTLENVPVYVHDTGSAFAGRPDKLDIAVGTANSDAQAMRLASEQPFLASRYQTYENITGQDLSARAYAGSGEPLLTRTGGAEVSAPVVGGDGRTNLAADIVPQAQNPRIAESAYGPSAESVHDINFNGLASLQRVESGEPLADLTPKYHEAIPTAEWIPEIESRTGEEITAQIREQELQDAQNAIMADRINQAPEDGSIVLNARGQDMASVNYDEIYDAAGAPNADIGNKSEAELQAIEAQLKADRRNAAPDTIASANLEPAPSLSHGILTLNTDEVKAAWADLFKSESATPLEGAPVTPVEIGGDLASTKSLIVPEGQSAVLTHVSLDQNQGLSGGFAADLGAPSITSEGEFSRFVSESQSSLTRTGTPDILAGDDERLQPAEEVPLPQSRPEVSVSDVPLPTNRPSDMPLQGTAKVPDILAGADERLQAAQENIPLPQSRPDVVADVPLPQERPAGAPLAGTGKVPEMLTTANDQRFQPAALERFADPSAQPWSAGGGQSVTLTCTGGGGVCGPDQKVTAAGAKPPEGYWLAVPKDNPEGYKIGDTVSVRVGDKVIESVPVADYTRSGSGNYVASGELAKDLGGTGKDAATISRYLSPSEIQSRIPTAEWIPEVASRSGEDITAQIQQQNINEATNFAAEYPAGQDTIRPDVAVNTNDAANFAAEYGAGQDPIRLDVMRAADLDGSYTLGDTSIRATKDGITYTDAQGAETYVPREQLGEQSVADIVGGSKVAGPLVQNTPASIAEIEQKYTQEVTTAQPPAEEKSWLGQRFDSFKEYFSPTEQKSDDQPKQQYASRTVCDACIPGTWEPEPAKNTSEDKTANVLNYNNATPPTSRDPWSDPARTGFGVSKPTTGGMNIPDGAGNEGLNTNTAVSGEIPVVPTDKTKLPNLASNNTGSTKTDIMPLGARTQSESQSLQEIANRAPTPQTQSPAAAQEAPAQGQAPAAPPNAPVTGLNAPAGRSVTPPSQVTTTGSPGPAPTAAQYTGSPFTQNYSPQYSPSPVQQNPFTGQVPQPQYVNAINTTNPLSRGQTPAGITNITQGQNTVQTQGVQQGTQNIPATNTNTQSFSLAEQIQQRWDAAKAEQNALDKIKAFLIGTSTVSQPVQPIIPQESSSITINATYATSTALQTGASTTATESPVRVIPSYTLPSGSTVEITGVVPQNAVEIILNLSGARIIADESGIALRDQLRQSGERVIGALVTLPTADLLATMSGVRPVQITIYPRLKGTFTRSIQLGESDTIQNIVNAGLTKTYQPIPQRPVSPLPVWGPNQIWTLQPTK